ncbi:MAG TPA: hypothetical protein V6D28_17110 [Leptolyngbyaceae cyanobacterium]
MRTQPMECDKFDAYAWKELLALIAEQTAQLMSLSSHKRPYYQRI